MNISNIISINKILINQKIIHILEQCTVFKLSTIKSFEILIIIDMHLVQCSVSEVNAVLFNLTAGTLPRIKIYSSYQQYTQIGSYQHRILLRSYQFHYYVTTKRPIFIKSNTMSRIRILIIHLILIINSFSQLNSSK